MHIKKSRILVRPER